MINLTIILNGFRLRNRILASITIPSIKQKPDSGEKPASPLTQREAARLLGVHYGHLNHVLRGRRISRSLSSRYAALQANQPEAK